VLLCSLVEACENLRSGRGGALIKGVDKNPKQPAARLANIRRALEVLRAHPGMPLELLWSELDFRAGVPHVVRGLLAQIFKAYHQK